MPDSDQDKRLYFSSLDHTSEQSVIEMFREEATYVEPDKPQHIVKSKNGILYTIKCQHLLSDSRQYTAFFFTRAKSPLNGSSSKRPLVSIDCALITDKTWEYLLSHHNSPLYDSQSTLYFHKVNTLPEEKQNQLISFLTSAGTCQRNHVIFSCDTDARHGTPLAGSHFINHFSCLTLPLTPLRQQPAQIPQLIHLYLSQLKLTLSNDISGIEPSALRLLSEYQWPQNYMQLKRVVLQIAACSDSETISLETVQSVLAQEASSASFPCLPNARINLNQTLEEIKKEIAFAVLQEENWNQTTAARRLGISRTTLWRMTGEKEPKK